MTAINVSTVSMSTGELIALISDATRMKVLVGQLAHRTDFFAYASDEQGHANKGHAYEVEAGSTEDALRALARMIAADAMKQTANLRKTLAQYEEWLGLDDFAAVKP